MPGVTAASVMLASTLGNIAFGVFVAIFFFAIVYGFYTRRGSGINQRPQGASQGESPGVGEGPSRVAGKDEGEQERFDEHGTR